MKITDGTRLGTAAAGYQAFLSSGDPTQVTDLANLYLASAVVDLGIEPPATATADQLLAASCAQCHNGTTDPTLTRAKFDATNLAGMSVAERSLAATRLALAPDDVKLMPPSNMRQLTASQVAALTQDLLQ